MKKQIIGFIKKHSKSQDNVFLCPDFASYVENGENIFIQYGQKFVKATAVFHKNKEVVAVSHNIWDALSLPFTHKVHLHFDGSTLHIGPLVGIITSGVFPHANYPVGKRTGFFKRYLYSQKEVPSSYFLFSPADISSTTKRIKGHFLRKKNGNVYFERHTIPFPDVVYNRVFRKSEKMRSFIRAKDRLETAGVKIFNPFCFNKWDIHQRIHSLADIYPYLPESIMSPSRSKLATLLKKHKTVFLKPADGYLGLGIVHMIYKPNQGIYCRYHVQEQNKLRRFPNLSSALRHIFGSRSLSGYIAQQGIRLLQMDGRTIDFRIHSNKDRNGEWKVTAAAAKMSGRGSVTTHIRTGGQLYSYQEIISRFFPDNENLISKRLETAVLALSKAIEDTLPGYVGDIGFDIGIDKSGYPWMFEANSQPGRHIFAHPSMKDHDMHTRKIILDYALFLSDFTTKDVAPWLE